jgi:predicted O-methyltransferase YrrM
MYIHNFLQENGFTAFEGFSQQLMGQIKDLIRLTATPGLRALEIGFNAGHSAEIFLENNESLKLTSFDLGMHDYVVPASRFIASKYPSRHEIVLGDSTVTLPKYIHENPGKQFDILFIDGGHTYEIAKADLENCAALSHSRSLVLVDDVIHTDGWAADYTVGPTQAWDEAVSDGKIIELGRSEYCHGRGMVWGNYVRKA